MNDNIIITWRQDYEQVECFEEGTVPIPLKKPVWHQFTPGLGWLPRNHFLDLFSGKVPVVAKENEIYYVNSKLLFKRYQQEKKRVRMFADLARSDKPLEVVGFGGGL